MPWALEPSLHGAQAMASRDEQAWREDRVYQFAIVDRDSAMVLGVSGLYRKGPDVAELHYWIRSDHAGRGLTT